MLVPDTTTNAGQGMKPMKTKFSWHAVSMKRSDKFMQPWTSDESLSWSAIMLSMSSMDKLMQFSLKEHDVPSLSNILTIPGSISLVRHLIINRTHVCFFLPTLKNKLLKEKSNKTIKNLNQEYNIN